jgi:hypothetical protein
VTHQKLRQWKLIRNIQKTLHSLGEITIADVWFFYECIFCTVAGGRLCCNHQCVGREGFGGWSICGKIFSDNRQINSYKGSIPRVECSRWMWVRLIIVYQYSETNVMYILFNLLRIKGLYIFRALLAHPQEALHIRHLIIACVLSRQG